MLKEKDNKNYVFARGSVKTCWLQKEVENKISNPLYKFNCMIGSFMYALVVSIKYFKQDLAFRRAMRSRLKWRKRGGRS